MALFFVIFGLASLAALGVLALSVILGAVLCFTKRFRTVGIFVLLVPTLSASLAATLSWGAVFLCNLFAEGASPAAWERWQVLAFWAWPIGFVVGGMVGGMLGILIGILIVRRTTTAA